MCPRGSDYHSDDGKHVRTHIRHRFWLDALLRRGAPRGPSYRCRRRFEEQFFLKNGARHQASVDEKKKTHASYDFP